MFPDKCGNQLAEAVAKGVNPKEVVPGEYFIVHGGTLAPTGSVFSAGIGPTLEAAAAAVPHGQIRYAQAASIRAQGGEILWIPEVTRFATMNQQHVNVTVADLSPFSPVQPNPVPRKQRIDGNQK